MSKYVEDLLDAAGFGGLSLSEDQKTRLTNVLQNDTMLFNKGMRYVIRQVLPSIIRSSEVSEGELYGLKERAANFCRVALPNTQPRIPAVWNIIESASERQDATPLLKLYLESARASTFYECPRARTERTQSNGSWTDRTIPASLSDIDRVLDAAHKQHPLPVATRQRIRGIWASAVGAA